MNDRFINSLDLDIFFFSDIWEEALDRSEEMIANISNYLECFEIDKFESVDTGIKGTFSGPPDYFFQFSHVCPAFGGIYL